MIAINHIFKKKLNQPITACKQYCLAAGATQGKIAYTQTVIANGRTTTKKFIETFNEDIHHTYFVQYFM